MPVQQHVLNWLYSVLTSEYQDVNRTYNDVAQALTKFQSLSPRTDVHTFPNGASALLLHLSGTIPVNFRGNTYRFPLSIWVPHAYPRAPPLIYVTPTDTMMVRPGQHVDPQGQVYHPYLVNWAEYWDKSTLQDLLTVLSDVFAKEPPVVSRQQARPTQSPQPVQAPPPIPPLPPEMVPSPVSRLSSTPSHPQSAPRPPPKPHSERSFQSPGSDTAGTPRPPGPSINDPQLQHQHQRASARVTSRYESAPPLPAPNRTETDLRHRIELGSPVSVQHGYRPEPAQLPPVQFAQHPQPDPRQPLPPGQYTGQGPPQRSQQWTQQQDIRAAAPPPPDLMDEPLTLDRPVDSNIAPPPIPPNPEKDALIRQLAQTLASIRQQSRQQNESSMAGLQAQRTAMLTALPAIQAEMGQLTQLSNILASNTAILHEALRKADAVVEGSRSHPAPDIDDLLVAPTVVSNQLYSLVAEERAIGDAIFMLGRAVERGRISTAAFAKMTRSLAREWYLKKALARKIGQGMGLTS